MRAHRLVKIFSVDSKMLFMIQVLETRVQLLCTDLSDYNGAYLELYHYVDLCEFPWYDIIFTNNRQLIYRSKYMFLGIQRKLEVLGWID